MNDKIIVTTLADALTVIAIKNGEIARLEAELAEARAEIGNLNQLIEPYA